MSSIFTGIMISFIETTTGMAYVFFLKNVLKSNAQKTFLGFASGVMVAASIWLLLIPSTDIGGHVGKPAFIPASVGPLLKIGSPLLSDETVPHPHINTEQSGGPKSDWKRSTVLVLAVTLHNIPEEMVVGVTFTGLLSQNRAVIMVGALASPVGIVIQSFPEGTVTSLPFKEAAGKGKVFTYGTLSGVVEPIDALLMPVLAEFLGPVLPHFLSFTADAMICVVVEELTPELAEREHSNVATTGFAVGFVVMVVLGVALGQDVLGFGSGRRNTIKRESTTRAGPHPYPE